jgi:brefeldin A-inhibited guanine nucleotide-exchange protein
MGNDTAFVLAYSTIMLNTDAHNPRLTGQARMSKEQFIESNRRTPDLANLDDAFMSGLYDEIIVNEIKMEGLEDPVAGAASPGAGDPKKRPRRRSISDMFSDLPPAAAAEQKEAFAELGQKMFDVQQVRRTPSWPKSWANLSLF